MKIAARFMLAMDLCMRYDEIMKPLVRSGRFFIALIIVVILILIVLGLNNRVAELRKLSDEAVRFQQQVHYLENTKLALEAEIAYATSESPVIKWAMEDMRWVRDETGEKLVIPLVDPDATPEPGEIEVVEVAAPQPENWQFWLALFFDGPELP